MSGRCEVKVSIMNGTSKDENRGRDPCFVGKRKNELCSLLLRGFLLVYILYECACVVFFSKPTMYKIKVFCS